MTKDIFETKSSTASTAEIVPNLRRKNQQYKHHIIPLKETLPHSKNKKERTTPNKT